MKVVAILFQLGAHCVSPLETGLASVTAYKVECATIVVAPEQESPPAATAAPAKRVVAQAPSKKVKKSGCVRRWYWKNHKRKWKCAR